MTQDKKDIDDAVRLAEKDPDFKKFWNAISGASDQVAVILRSHLLTEFYLDRLIAIVIPRGDIIVDGRFQFSEKITIVESLDILKKEVVDAIRKLNSVRNHCSHVLDYKISETDIEKIGIPFGSEYLADKKICGDDEKRLLHHVIMSIMVALSGVVKREEEKQIAKYEILRDAKLKAQADKSKPSLPRNSAGKSSSDPQAT